MRQISNSDFATLCRVLKILTKGENRANQGANAKRQATLLLRKFERSNSKNNGTIPTQHLGGAETPL